MRGVCAVEEKCKQYCDFFTSSTLCLVCRSSVDWLHRFVHFLSSLLSSFRSVSFTEAFDHLFVTAFVIVCLSLLLLFFILVSICDDEHARAITICASADRQCAHEHSTKTSKHKWSFRLEFYLSIWKCLDVLSILNIVVLFVETIIVTIIACQIKIFATNYAIFITLSDHENFNLQSLEPEMIYCFPFYRFSLHSSSSFRFQTMANRTK